MKKYSKLQNAVLTIVTVLIVVIAAFVAVWYNELSSISTIEMIVDVNEENKSVPVYTMDVRGDYYFGDFIEQCGASSDAELGEKEAADEFQYITNFIVTKDYYALDADKTV